MNWINIHGHNHEAIIFRNEEWYVYDYISVRNDPLFTETGTFDRNGITVHIFELTPP